MVSYLERTVDDTESLVTFISLDAEHLPATKETNLKTPSMISNRHQKFEKLLFFPKIS